MRVVQCSCYLYINDCSGENLGWDVKFGDFNGDSWMDIIVSGDEYADNGSNNEGGRSIAFYNTQTYPYFDSIPDWSYISTKSYCSVGESIDTADINNDGYYDAIIGASRCGEVYIFHGSSTGLSTNIDTTLITDRIPSSLSSFGENVVNLGDVNGDDIDDILISDSSWIPTGADQYDDWGRIYVYYGSNSGISSSNVWKYPNDNPGTDFNDIQFGHSVDCIGDINGDNLNDFAVTTGDNSNLYIFLGNTDGISDSVSKIIILDNSDYYVKRLGDINNDGFDDFITDENTYSIYFGSTDIESISVFTDFDGLPTPSHAYGFWVTSFVSIESNHSSLIVIGDYLSGTVQGITDYSCIQQTAVSTTDTNNDNETGENDDNGSGSNGNGLEWYIILIIVLGTLLCFCCLCYIGMNCDSIMNKIGDKMSNDNSNSFSWQSRIMTLIAEIVDSIDMITDFLFLISLYKTIYFWISLISMCLAVLIWIIRFISGIYGILVNPNELRKYLAVLPIMSGFVFWFKPKTTTGPVDIEMLELIILGYRAKYLLLQKVVEDLPQLFIAIIYTLLHQKTTIAYIKMSIAIMSLLFGARGVVKGILKNEKTTEAHMTQMTTY